MTAPNRACGGEALGPLSPQGDDDLLQELVVGQQLVDGVHAVTADRREDVVEHPRLELPGGGQLGGDETRQGILCVGVAEGGRYVLAAEQDLPA